MKDPIEMIAEEVGKELDQIEKDLSMREQEYSDEAAVERDVEKYLETLRLRIPILRKIRPICGKKENAHFESQEEAYKKIVEAHLVSLDDLKGKLQKIQDGIDMLLKDHQSIAERLKKAEMTLEYGLSLTQGGSHETFTLSSQRRGELQKKVSQRIGDIEHQLKKKENLTSSLLTYKETLEKLKELHKWETKDLRGPRNERLKQPSECTRCKSKQESFDAPKR